MNSQRSRPGCFGYGCLIAVVLFTVVIGAVAYRAWTSLQQATARYTSTCAPPLVVEPVLPDAAIAGRERYRELVQAFSTSQPSSVSFSEAELRGLVQSSDLKDALDLSIVQDELALRFSLPLALLGEWEAASMVVSDIATRSIVGSAKIKATSTRDGKVQLSFSELVLNDSTLGDLARGHAADWVLGAAQATISAYLKATSQPDVIVADRLRSISISDNKITVEFKGN